MPWNWTPPVGHVEVIRLTRGDLATQLELHLKEQEGLSPRQVQIPGWRIVFCPEPQALQTLEAAQRFLGRQPLDRVDGRITEARVANQVLLDQRERSTHQITGGT